MDSRPVLRRPRSPLDKHIELFGYWRCDAAYRSRALPRGGVTVILDVGERQQLDFYAADGRTRLAVPPAFVAGPDSASYVSDIAADEPVVAIHFRPAGAFPFLGIPLGDLENRRVGLGEVWGRDGHVLHERLIEATSVSARMELLESFLLTRAQYSPQRHPGIAGAMAAIEEDPSIRIGEVSRLTGRGTKRLIALFRAEVGLSPKEYARVRRFQAALQRMNTGVVNGALVAVDLGYFDQAHFVREFKSFSGMTPSDYRRQPIVLPSHVPVGQKYPIPSQPACA